MPDLLTIAQLKQVANSTPQPYAIQAQVDGAMEKQTQQGKPYFELRLTDGSESLLWRVVDSNPAFEAVRDLPPCPFNHSDRSAQIRRYGAGVRRGR